MPIDTINAAGECTVTIDLAARRLPAISCNTQIACPVKLPLSLAGPRSKALDVPPLAASIFATAAQTANACPCATSFNVRCGGDATTVITDLAGALSAAAASAETSVAELNDICYTYTASTSTRSCNDGGGEDGPDNATYNYSPIAPQWVSRDMFGNAAGGGNAPETLKDVTTGDYFKVIKTPSVGSSFDVIDGAQRTEGICGKVTFVTSPTRKDSIFTSDISFSSITSGFIYVEINLLDMTAELKEAASVPANAPAGSMYYPIAQIDNGAIIQLWEGEIIIYLTGYNGYFQITDASQSAGSTSTPSGTAVSIATGFVHIDNYYKIAAVSSLATGSSGYVILTVNASGTNITGTHSFVSDAVPPGGAGSPAMAPESFTQTYGQVKIPVGYITVSGGTIKNIKQLLYGAAYLQLTGFPSLIDNYSGSGQLALIMNAGGWEFLSIGDCAD